MSASRFLAGVLNGLMGGMLGLGGAALRVPRLAGVRPLDAIVLCHADGLVMVAAAWMFRAKIVPLAVLATHLDVVASLLAGSLAGAWLAAGKTRAWPAVMVLLAGLSLASLDRPDLAWGVLAGAGAGLVMAYSIGGGLLLVPAMVVLYGLDIKVAGSLALMVSLPMLLVGLLRVRAEALAVLHREQRQFAALACGAVLGAALGTLLLGLLPSRFLMTLLEALLVYAAILNFVIFPQNFYKLQADRGEQDRTGSN